MMSDKEIELIDALLKERKPKYCLEFGSGGSTLYFPRHRFIRLWLSIEHDGNWLKKIAPKLRPNTAVIWVNSDAWYVDSVKHGRKFDFILIDGLWRERCLEHARDILNPGGVILVHDSGRADLYELISKHNGALLVDGEEPLGERFKHRGIAIYV